MAPERLVEEAAAPPPPSMEDGKEREAANQARQRAETAHRELEGWEAHLAYGRLAHAIADAEGAAQDPHLADPVRRRLEAEARLARRRLDAHGALGDWRAACRIHADDAASRGRHVIDHPGHEDLVAAARRLADDSALSETARQAVTSWLSDHAGMADARRAFLERRALWTRLEADGKDPLDLPEAGDVVSWFRENLENAGVTGAERQVMKDVVARHDERQADRIRPDRGISWRL